MTGVTGPLCLRLVHRAVEKRRIVIEQGRVVDRNLAAALRYLSSAATRADVVDDSGLLLVADRSGRVSPFFNAVVRLEPAVPAHDLLDRAAAFFGPRGAPFTVWTSAHADADVERLVRAVGLRPLGPAAGWAGMVLEHTPEQTEPPPGLRLAVVEDQVDVADFAVAAAAAYSLPLDLVQSRFPAPDALRSPRATAVVARVGTTAVGCALAIMDGGTAGIYWVATVAGARRRGVGELMTRTVARAAFDRGADAVVLQATPMAEEIYRRMGFVGVTRYRHYAR